MTEEQSKFNDACINGEMDIIDSMLEAGFDVNYCYNGVTPLQAACCQDSLGGFYIIDVVTKLITNGADVNMNNNGLDALSHCLSIIPFQRHVAQLLLDCSKLGVDRLDWCGKSYLFYAKTVEACKFLIDNGIKINNVDNFDKTVLDYYSSAGFDYYRVDFEYSNIAEMSDYLISMGAKKYSEM